MTRDQTWKIQKKLVSIERAAWDKFFKRAFEAGSLTTHAQRELADRLAEMSDEEVTAFIENVATPTENKYIHDACSNAATGTFFHEGFEVRGPSITWDQDRTSYGWLVAQSLRGVAAYIDRDREFLRRARATDKRVLTIAQAIQLSLHAMQEVHWRAHAALYGKPAPRRIPRPMNFTHRGIAKRIESMKIDELWDFIDHAENDAQFIIVYGIQQALKEAANGNREMASESFWQPAFNDDTVHAKVAAFALRVVSDLRRAGELKHLQEFGGN